LSKARIEPVGLGVSLSTIYRLGFDRLTASDTGLFGGPLTCGEMRRKLVIPCTASDEG
jgi:hypothetical protein